MSYKKLYLILACLFSTMAIASADTMFSGALEGRSVRPVPVVTAAWGQASALLQAPEYFLLLNATYSGPGTPTSAVLCGPAWVNSTGSVLYTFVLTGSSGNTTHFEGSYYPTPEVIRAFQLGLLYIQVNTVAHPQGELRTQLPSIPYEISPEHPLGTIASAEVSLNGATKAIRTNLSIAIADDAGHNITDHLQFSTNTLNRFFEISSAVQPSFAFFADSLTNGLTNWIQLSTDMNGSSIAKPEYLFFQSSTSTNGFDLKGWHVDRVLLRVNDLKLTSPGSNPNHDGLWTDFNFGLTLFFISDSAKFGPISKVQALGGSNDQIRLSFPTVTNQTYSVEYSTELGSPKWLSIQLISGTGEEISIELRKLWPHAFFTVVPTNPETWTAVNPVRPRE